MRALDACHRGGQKSQRYQGMFGQGASLREAAPQNPCHDEIKNRNEREYARANGCSP